KEDVIRVIMAARGEVRDYLWTIALTLGRMSEINRLEWKDVDFENNSLQLYTRKSRGGNLVPRTIPICSTLRDVLDRRRKGNPTQWVFWHRYWSKKAGEWVTGPYQRRNRIMKSLCDKAGVKYFRFHPLRHFGASQMMKEGVDPKTIQELLGHSNFRTTEIYLHLIRGTNQDAVSKLDSMLTGGGNVLRFEKRKTKTQD
ncbi:MAG: site-specific integrase, partial [Desulfobacterales bacterium]|nr:site-specific integrase [Desulfobacterales bacterium]